MRNLKGVKPTVHFLATGESNAFATTYLFATLVHTRKELLFGHKRRVFLFGWFFCVSFSIAWPTHIFSAYSAANIQFFSAKQQKLIFSIKYVHLQSDFENLTP